MTDVRCTWLAQWSVGLLCTVAVLLAGCGSDGPPEQEWDTAPSLTGRATYGVRVGTGDVTAKGVSGPVRTATNSTGTNRYTVTLTQLTAPYILRWEGPNDDDQQVTLYTVATREGIANITPLTTLLVAQLLGQEPEAAYAGFSSGAVRTDLITEEGIQDAQARLTGYLQDVMGIEVRAGSASFITTPFEAVAGDPIFDTMQALDAWLAADGSTLAGLARQLAEAARLCIEERILITVNGQQQEFCPAAKSAEPEEDDSSVLGYLFMNQAGDTVRLRVRADEVLGAQYVTAAGVSYTCSAAACSAIALGAPAEDLTRSISFGNVELAGADGSAVLSGSLMGAIPGVALPVLPCDHNRFFLILDDRSVIADCVDAFDPLGLGGTLNLPRGAEPSRAAYNFLNGADPEGSRVELVMDANESVLSVYFSRLDPVTFERYMHYVCEVDACNGITLGPVTVNTDLGPDTPILVRQVTLEDTMLFGLNADGSLTGRTATLKASFTTVYFVDPFSPMRFPPLQDCAAGSEPVSITVHSGPFNFCSPPEKRFTTVFENGETRLHMEEASVFHRVTVVMRSEAVVGARYETGFGYAYICSEDCAGVTVSPPDPDGNRTVTFSGLILREEQSFPLPGERTAILNGGPLLFPPPD